MELEKTLSEIQRYANIKTKKTIKYTPYAASFDEYSETYVKNDFYKQGKRFLKTIAKENKTYLLVHVVTKDISKARIIDTAHQKYIRYIYLKIKYIEHGQEKKKYLLKSAGCPGFKDYFEFNLDDVEEFKNITSLKIGILPVADLTIIVPREELNNNDDDGDSDDDDEDEKSYSFSTRSIVEIPYTPGKFANGIYIYGHGHCATCHQLRLKTDFRSGNATCDYCLLKAKEKRMMKKINN